MPALKILSWNILHGGGTRCEQILEVLHQYSADIVTLQEFRHGRHSAMLLEGLKSLGLTTICAPQTANARENSLIVASRVPMRSQRFPAEVSGLARAIEATLEISPTLNINMIAGHFPQKREQVPYFTALQDLPARWLSEHSLIIGDLNCGIPFEDSQTKTFYATHQFQQLLHSGWRDAWRKRNPDAREYTWISTRKSNGFRYDHALVTEALDELIVSVQYDHSVREKKYSDHSCLLLELDC